jgi:hypothetical protein
MGYAAPAGDVFGIGNAYVNGPLLDDFRQALGKHTFARVSENIADE